ncbi:MAG: homoserine dehydrogenase, partial [Ruminococcaceae bacterium]|nr:homoserine dehydrogenase [Oscillospiraceae bacterium]
ARQNKVSYLFEASVGGGIPIIRPMCNDLASNNVIEINGILNGTTNYILTRMMAEGAAFDDVLADAQQKGYAERNPAADVEGLDAARKIVILAALAYGVAICPDDIHTEGITDISSDDVEIASSLGYALKLIGHAEKTQSGILAMVSPRAIPVCDPLASINGVFNGILLDCDMVDRVMFYGPGAGKLPTASAVCADIVDIAAHGQDGIKLPDFKVASCADIADFSSYSCRRLFIFKPCSDCQPKIECAQKLFGELEVLRVFGDKVAVITAEPMREDCALKIREKLTDCKIYRIL